LCEHHKVWVQPSTPKKKRKQNKRSLLREMINADVKNACGFLFYNYRVEFGEQNNLNFWFLSHLEGI
jgi:hypothetical protein